MSKFVALSKSEWFVLIPKVRIVADDNFTVGIILGLVLHKVINIYLSTIVTILDLN